MNRQEHLQWCKDRANEYVDAGDNQQAMSSMASDLRKHPETESSAAIAFPILMMAVNDSAAKMREAINGFN